MKRRGGASFLGMVLTRVMWIALLWWALAGGGAWAFGAAVIVLAVAASLALQPTPRVRISLPALFPFLTFFALRSVHAGFDVARRALSPRLPIAPSLVDLRLRLPPGPSRVFLADIMSLLPGTLSADLVDDRLRLHVLDTRLPTEQGLRAAEAVVAALFGQTLIALPGEP